MPDFTVDIWGEIFVIGWLLTASGGLDATMRWPKTGVYGWKTAARSEAFFFRQSDNFILLSITRSPAQGSACKDLERDGQRPVFMDEKLQQGQKHSSLGNSIILFCFL
ncbi:hypothetical protein [Lacticaseibacillus rhamnosus]|uniref:hypothetical protein n=1 Tax=Lacticaseibacillus rhamnosus TaxID=47715 RepID=UPI00237FD440|nr:hypothetical protein [Lacticaseibacillus rhamnosus]MDE3296783.1 hypothetical protein [Lacticaseibacillus rhamnosus]